MADNIRDSFDRGMRQEQPRKAPAKRGGGWLYVVIIVIVLLVAGGAALYILNPSWLPFFAGPKDIVLETGSHIVFDGRATEMTAGQGNTVVQGVAEEGRTTVIIRSRRKNARAVGTTEGAYVQLKPSVSSELAGKRVRVTVWARAGMEKPSTLFAVAYSRGGSGTTGWIAFDPSKDIKPYSFVYRVPAAATQNTTGDYVGVWSDVSGLGGALEVRLITVRVMG